MAEQKTLSWADAVFEEAAEKDYETPVDENGIKYTYQYGTNKEGNKTCTTRKIAVTKKVVTINKRVEDRRQGWQKFGRVAGIEGIEPGATYRGEEVFLIMNEEKDEIERKEQLARDTKELEELYTSLLLSSSPSARPNFADVWRPDCLRSTGAYVPPHQKALAGQTKLSRQDEDELHNSTITTLRVSNLSEELNEDDIAEMCRDYGKVNRVHLVRDRESHMSKGFCFITFQYKSEAEAALKALQGRGVSHLILCVEWAKPSTK